ncbi:MAG: hypothetical protein V1717_03305 [Candidatus Micrarchaeota archaeon]
MDSIKSLELETFKGKPGFRGALVTTALEHFKKSRGMNPSIGEIQEVARLVDEWARKAKPEERHRGKIIDLTKIACTWV